MSMDLKNMFEDKLSKSKIKGIKQKAGFDVMYSTGFLGIDYLNGTTIFVESKDRNFSYNSTGIVDGSTNTIIGRSGCGKSTLEIQICANIIRPFPAEKSKLYIDDIEGSLPTSRKEFLLGFNKEELENRVIMRDTGITTENVYMRIKTIHDIKIENRKEFEYDTELYDTYGNRIKKFYPTVYLIDSLPMLLPEDIAEDNELGSSMDASSIAKKNTLLTKKISQLCKEANIILFTINHILDDINMGFTPKPVQIAGLKLGERLPGGKAAIYLANNMFRIDDKETLTKEKSPLGIDGSVVDLSIIKSRTNVNRKSVPLVFNKTEGKFDEILSLFYLLNSEERIKGSGISLYLEDAPNVKFRQKTFKETLENSEELQIAFAKECYGVLSSYLSITKNVANSNSALVNNITNLISSFGGNAA